MVVYEESPAGAAAPAGDQARQALVEGQQMAARAGHLAVEHRPADVLDMNDRAGPIARRQLIIGDLIAACAVRVHERITAAGCIDIGPTTQREASAVAKELVDAQREIRGWQIGAVDIAGIQRPPADRARTGEGRLIRASGRIGAEFDRGSFVPRPAEDQLLGPPGVAAFEQHAVARQQAQTIDLADGGKWGSSREAVVIIISCRAGDVVRYCGWIGRDGRDNHF